MLFKLFHVYDSVAYFTSQHIRDIFIYITYKLGTIFGECLKTIDTQ